jgi:serine/threonine protein kinase
MAPEQHRGEPADARSDQFSFAVALYEALYGERPFAGASYRELVRNVYAGAVRPAAAGTEVPGSIRSALLRALGVDRATRYPSIEALLEDVVRPPVRARRRWPRVAITVVIAAATVIAAGAFVATRSSSSVTPTEAAVRTDAAPPPAIDAASAAVLPDAPVIEVEPPPPPAPSPPDARVRRRPPAPVPPAPVPPAPSPELAGPDDDDLGDRRRRLLELED